MGYLRWGKLDSIDGGHSQPLVDETGTTVAVYSEVNGQKTMSLGQGESWRLSGSNQSGLVATLPDGRVFTASGRGRKIGSAKAIDADCSGEHFTFINEVKSDWIIDDAKNRKVGQFTGAQHGVRQPQLDLETDRPAPAPETSVFLAYVAREALTGKMLTTTMIVTLCLLLLAPFIILVFLL